jgi:rsbT antagonist protein RsbS
MPEETSRIPISKLHDNLIVSIQGALSDRLVAQLKDDVTDRIKNTKVFGLIIDVSGIDMMDSYITRTIRDIGLISRLMGVNTIICGMNPMIAMTLVEMGLGLKGVWPERNLEEALVKMQLWRKRSRLDARRRGRGRRSRGSK